MKTPAAGFTLIELLIVIAIIGILAAVLIPSLLGAQKRSYDAGAQSCAKSLQTAQSTMQVDKQGYFKADKALNASSITYTDGSVTGTGTGVDGVNAGCVNTNMVISTATATVSAYSITVKDNRGSKTYTVTNNSLN